MENLFLQKNIVQKLIIAIVLVILFNFISPTACQAKGFWIKAGGELLEPIMELFMAIADAVLNALQRNLVSDLNILMPATSEEYKDKKRRCIKDNRSNFMYRSNCCCCSCNCRNDIYSYCSCSSSRCSRC